MSQESLALTVAVLVTDGFEQVELTEPRAALDKAGAKTLIVFSHGCCFFAICS